MSVKWNVYESFQALLEASPYHLAFEGVLLVWVIWLLVAAKSRPRVVKLTKKEEEQLITEWSPEPLLSSPPDVNHPALHSRTVTGKLGHYVDIDGNSLLNLSSHDYLRLSENKTIEEAALSCLHEYGVGSCGPRGFFGTTAVHLELEKRIAEFFKTECAVLYSYGFSTVASVIPAYAKSGDIIFVDEAVCFPIQRGLQASRSRIIYFKHNDADHLQHLLEIQHAADKKDPKKASATRRFLVVEGIYLNTGNICCLPQLVELRKKYKLRLFIDESYSFGSLGKYARGVTDHFNIPLVEVDLIMASLEAAGASTGGFCTGTKFVVEHQKLSAMGYVFSASLPPMLAAAAKQMFNVLEANSESLVCKLQNNCSKLHNRLITSLPAQVSLKGDVISPVKHLNVQNMMQLSVHEQENMLYEVIKEAESHGLALVVASLKRSKEHSPPPPSIRLAVNVKLTEKELQKTIAAVNESFQTVINRY